MVDGTHCLNLHFTLFPRRIARRPARRIAALNHSHLSALSGGLALLCGGDWQPLLGLPSSTGCVAGWYHCRPVRHLLCWPQPSDGSPLPEVMAEPARLSTLSALHSASGLPSLCAGGECIQAAPVSSAPRSHCTSRPLLCAPHPYASSLRPTSHWTLRAF